MRSQLCGHLWRSFSEGEAPTLRSASQNAELGTAAGAASGSRSIQRTQLAQGGREARVYGRLTGSTYDYQWRPPAERDASGSYFFTFARDGYGKWHLSGGPYRE